MLLQQFIPSIKCKILPPLDRLALLDDLFALVSNFYMYPNDLLLLVVTRKNLS